MACYHPIPAYQPQTKITAGGVRAPPPKLYPPKGTANLALPCGTCVGCKSARATQWANRSEHEARQYDHNTFLTLTYDDDHLPPGGELDAAQLCRFIKRLRKAHRTARGTIQRDPHRNLRYLGCGEYGEKTLRPHYHVILYNCGFRTASRVGRDLWETDILRELWPYGRHGFGPATPGAANYIAQYTLKKQQRDRAGRNPGYVDQDGVWYPTAARGRQYLGHQAPFIRMSLHPGIGAGWLDRYKHDLQHGYLVAGGRRTRIPRAYIKRLELQDPELAKRIKERAAKHAERINNEDWANQEDRRRAAELIHRRMKQLTEHRKL